MNVTSILMRQLQIRPHALAVRYAGQELSYDIFCERMLRAAGGLKDAGIRSGETVAIGLSDPLAHFLATLALAHCGAIGISVPGTMQGPQRDRLLGQTGCKTLLTDDDPAAPPKAEGQKRVWWKDIADHSLAAGQTPAIVKEGQPWLYVTGSGSTGRPKIMPISHLHQVRRAEAGLKWLPYGSDDVLLSLVSMHFYAAKQRALEAIALGAGLYLDKPGRIDHRGPVARGEVSAIYATVVHLERLLAALPADTVPHYHKLRALMVGGSSVSMELRDRISTRLTPNFYVLWGTNETHTATITDLSRVRRTRGTVGRAFPDVRIEVVDNADQVVPTGNHGLIRVCSPALIDGYLNDPEATGKAFKDGWFYTGDRGYMTEDGELIHLGRADDMMNVGGVNLYPAEIEECLRSVSGVTDALALPLRHAQTHQDIPVALVETRPGAALDPNFLAAFVRAHVGPHALHHLRIVERIPRNGQGKVQREEVNRILRETWLDRTKAVPAPTGGTMLGASRNEGVLSFKFSRPDKAGPAKLTPWLALLDTGLVSPPAGSTDGPVSDPDRDWLEQVLTLTRGLMNLLYVPLFEPIQILACHRSKSAGNRTEAVCRLPETARVPGALIQALLKVAFRLAAWSLDADVTSVGSRQQFYDTIDRDVLKAFEHARPSDKSTFALLQGANDMGIACHRLSDGIYQLGSGPGARRIGHSTVDLARLPGGYRTDAKISLAARLRDAGLPATECHRATKLAEAKHFASKFGFPVVVKPEDVEGKQWLVDDDAETDSLQTAFNAARTLAPSRTVLLKRQVPGDLYRLLIASGQLLYAVKRLPFGVYADGHSTIASLVELERERQELLPPWKRSGRFLVGELATRMLTRQGWTSGSVPPAGTFIALCSVETTRWSGIDEDVTSQVHPDNIVAALAAARLQGLDVAGVDFVTTQINRPWKEAGGVITGVNYAPLPDSSKISQRHMVLYLGVLLEDRRKIPVHVYLGGSEAWAEAERHWNKLRASGIAAFITNDRETRDASGSTSPIAGHCLGDRINALRIRKDVEALVIVVQSLPCLRDTQILDHVTSFDLVGQNPHLALRNPQNLPQSAVLQMIGSGKARCMPPPKQAARTGPDTEG